MFLNNPVRLRQVKCFACVWCTLEMMNSTCLATKRRSRWFATMVWKSPMVVKIRLRRECRYSHAICEIAINPINCWLNRWKPSASAKRLRGTSHRKKRYAYLMTAVSCCIGLLQKVHKSNRETSWLRIKAVMLLIVSLT